MSKIRTIKPEFFRHENLFEAERKYRLPLRLAFAGLFTCCDREGRFRWRPRQLKLDILPYDEVDFEKILAALHTENFIRKYEKSGEYYGYIPSWNKHQTINTREPESKLPDPDTGTHVYAHAKHGSAQEPLVSAHLEVEMEGKWKGNGSGLCTQPPCPAPISDPLSLPVVTITLNDHSEYAIIQTQINEWQQLYPAVDVPQALRNIRGWNLANPKKRKIKSGILKHITHWLAGEQNRGGSHGAPTVPASRKVALQAHNQAVAEQWLKQNHGMIIDGEITHDA